MSTKIVQMQDESGNDEFPKTSTRAVYDDENNRLDNTLSSINDSLKNKADCTYGSVSVTRASGANTVNITFPKEFKTTPFIGVTYATGQPARFIPYYTSATTTGATVGLWNTGEAVSTSVTMYWVAIGIYK